ncbi:hypothetical protein C7S14_2386 [Burkholderia cepacia]|nr:hypothetical protein [Burkholderia cepacia]QOH37506.1 hypothetical protein C7S14_2386 [Burkholderia cepacia]
MHDSTPPVFPIASSPARNATLAMTRFDEPAGLRDRPRRLARACRYAKVMSPAYDRA